ncbi:stage III sporulation protein AF [Phosphitispora fastidiosa]|uniref:stage III sporulation protein AF n=1 Tax=Phosphitispora fastidiosa TaxID=2837202 RepID=UPI001E49D2C6|nr:stage III sporulation protein AF [Phosphitispora fastidiosa]MBU7007631.1 stage III sporulation protein AF [Phosphitispora fastidiosa]
METLRLMVKSILIIILMTAFLEIVLPRSDIKRYINLIIGLFIIIAVLNPILAIFNTGFDFEVLSAAPEGITGDTEALINQGRDIARARDNRVAGDYKEKLEKQVRSLSGLYQNNNVTDVQVDMVADTAAPDFGKINKIVLWIDDSATVNSAGEDAVTGRSKDSGSKREKDTGSSQEKDSGKNQGQIDIQGQVGVDEVEVNIEVAQSETENSADPENSEKPGTDRGLREMVADFYGLSPEQIEIRNQEVSP